MIGHRNKAAAAAVIAMLVLALAGCEKEGPAEKAGKEIDKAMSDVGNQIQAVGDKVQGTVK